MNRHEHRMDFMATTTQQPGWVRLVRWLRLESSWWFAAAFVAILLIAVLADRT